MSISNIIVEDILSFAEKSGIDVETAFKKFNVNYNRAKQNKKNIDDTIFLQIWESILKASNDPIFGLHLGKSIHDFPGGNLIFHIMRNCPTLGSAIKKLCAYFNVLTDALYLRFIDGENEVAIRYEMNETFPVYNRHIFDTLMAAICDSIDDYSGGTDKPIEIRFKHETEHTNEYRNFFGDIPVVFGQKHNDVVLQKSTLKKPIALSNEKLLENLEDFAKKELESNFNPSAASDNVAICIRKIPDSTKPDINDIAKSLGMSRRSLQKCLKKEGTNFRQILERIRKERALKLLKSTDLTVSEIALTLGYSDQSSFSHAFKHWIGKSPGKYR